MFPPRSARAFPIRLLALTLLAQTGLVLAADPAPATPPSVVQTPAAPATAVAEATPAIEAAVAPAVTPPAQGADALRPNGPVTVTADHAEWQQDGVMTYTGHVLLVSSSLTLKGDSMALKQSADGQYTAQVNGAPAQMDHAAGIDSKGQPTPPVSAKSDSMHYDSRTGIVDLVGKAVLTRGKDEINSSTIHYNVAQRHIQALGDGAGGQVKIVIQPPPPGPKSKDKKP